MPLAIRQSSTAWVGPTLLNRACGKKCQCAPATLPFCISQASFLHSSTSVPKFGTPVLTLASDDAIRRLLGVVDNAVLRVRVGHTRSVDLHLAAGASVHERLREVCQRSLT